MSVGTDAAAGADIATPDEVTGEKEPQGATTDHTSDAEDTTQPRDPPVGGADAGSGAGAGGHRKVERKIVVSRLIAYGVLPGLVVVLAAAASYLKWQDTSARIVQLAGIESVAAARDGTIAMLSYQPDTAEQDLGAARDRMTGTFKESYTQLTNDVVIPGAKQRHISAVATVPAVASVSATGSHAVALVFVNQTVIVGVEAPTATASSVRVTLDKVGDRWLMSGFDPI